MGQFNTCSHFKWKKMAGSTIRIQVGSNMDNQTVDKWRQLITVWSDSL